MIRIATLVWALAAFLPVQATTVTRASFDDLILKSTSIVRGRVAGATTGSTGSLIYTYYNIQVIERWKGSDGAQIQVRIPGGLYNGIQQNIAGSPQLTDGAEYIFFLWAGPSRTTHLLGLSQGVLDVVKDASGADLVVRQPSEAQAFDSKTGSTASLDPLQMKLSDFSSRVSKALKSVDSAK